ncbi:MAG: hypothetical protein AB1390_08485, partial [Nitrospirota bacterium]
MQNKEEGFYAFLPFRHHIEDLCLIIQCYVKGCLQVIKRVRSTQAVAQIGFLQSRFSLNLICIKLFEKQFIVRVLAPKNIT